MNDSSMPDHTEGPNQSTDESNTGCIMNSDMGNLLSDPLGGMTPEVLLTALHNAENRDIQREATWPCTPNSGDMSGLQLAIITRLFWKRFERCKRREDLDMSIQFAAMRLQLTPDNDFDRVECLIILGVLYHHRFQQLDDLEDQDKALGFMEQAAMNASFNHPYKLAILNNLGSSYQSRFERLGRLDDLNKSVNYNEQAVMSTPDGHPHKSALLNNLGSSCQLLFEHLGRLDYLDKAVNCDEQAVILTPDSHPHKLALLNNLGSSYQVRFQRLGRLDDLNKAVNYLEQAAMLTPESHPYKPVQLNNLGISYRLLFENLGRLDDLDKSVKCTEQAVMLTPYGHPNRPGQLNNLGVSYQLLFERLGRLGDLDKAVNCKEQAVMSTPDGHTHKPGWLNNLGVSYQLLFERLGRLDDLHKAVSCNQQAVVLTSDDHHDKPGWLNNLGSSYQLLFEHLGRQDDLGKSIDCKEQSVKLAPDSHPGKPRWLNNLGNSYQLLFEHRGRLSDLEKSVNCHKEAVVSTLDGHPDKPLWLTNLGSSYIILFRRLGRFKDANQAADCLWHAERLSPDGHPLKSLQLNALGQLHWDMFNHSQLPEHGLSALNFRRCAALIPTGDPSLRLVASHCWALLSRLFDPFSLEGHAHFMTLLPLVVWLGTSVPQRYERLMRYIGSLVTDAVASAISLQQYDLAVEWFEQRRSVVWGQTLQLRTSLDDLHAIHPDMAQELQHVSYQLDCASMYNLAEQVPAHDGLSLHQIAWRHRQLAERREELLASARLLPGLEDFLRPPKASKLMNMVQDGVLVMVNVNNCRCDALVLHVNPRAITHVPLPGFSSQKAEKARDDLTRCLRACGLRRGVKKGHVEGKATFRDILAMLWHDVVKPILDHLGITQHPKHDDLPHITWCSTGPLSFLPLHAAGDYNNPGAVLSNRAISSYTPTISSLGQHPSSTSTFSGILAIGHESPIRNLSPLPGTKDELDQVQEWAKSMHFTRLDEGNACANTVLKEMGNHSWVHFACHASQNPMDPMKSAFHLHDKDLDLATIARNPLKNAQFAFLSACQTATGDAALPDESVHLAAGLLMVGFPTVIATMWSINDKDAPLVAGKVYECLMEGGVADSRKAAKALHNAVASLREKIGVDEFARWVPYVHIGR